MAAALLPDRLWDRVEPFLPILPRRPQGGRPRVSDRAWVYFCSANTSATFSARAAVLACATLDATATTIPLSRRVISDITLPPASRPLTLSAFVTEAKRTRSDGVE